MWTLDAPAPDFRVRTPSGAIGPAEYHGGWLALLHCTRPCVPGCGTCLARFESLADALHARGCRLLVAVDEPDDELRELLGRRHEPRHPALAIGTWESPDLPHPSATQFVVLDPDGHVKGVLERPNDRPVPAEALLAEVDLALGGTTGRHPRPTEPAPADAFGCVDWYEYKPPGELPPR